MILLNSNKTFNKSFKFINLILNPFKISPNEINSKFSLLNNFLLNDTKLLEINKLSLFTLNEILNLFNLIKQYTTQLLIMTEFTYVKLITTEKKIQINPKNFQHMKKKYKKQNSRIGKKVCVFYTKKLNILQAAETKIKIK